MVVSLVLLQSHCLGASWTAQDSLTTLGYCICHDHCMFDVCDFCTSLNNLLSSPQVELHVIVPLDSFSTSAFESSEQADLTADLLVDVVLRSA